MALLALSRARVTFVALICAGAIASGPVRREFVAARTRAIERACAANCKTIAGAMEMFNLDH